MKALSEAPQSKVGPGVSGIVMPLLAAGYLFYSGINTLETKEIDIRHKGSRTEHVSGDRATSYGIWNLVIGVGALGTAGIQMVRYAAAGTPDQPSGSSPDDKDRNIQS